MRGGWAYPLVLSLMPTVSYAQQCSPQPERTTSYYVPDYLYVVSTSSMSAVDPNAVTAAASMWDGCASGTNRPGFPYPVTNPTWDAPTAQLNVVFHTGFNPDNQFSCGSTQGTTINVYSNAHQNPGNVVVSCASYGYNQIIAHELGHYFGLNDILNQPNCPDIMSQLNGQLHYVIGSDCDQANFLNVTIDENGPIDYSCTQPCYTMCVAGACPAQNAGSPIVFDLDGQGFRLSGPDDPVYFDLDATGTPIWTAWTARDAGTAFLALDLNGNGTIDDGGELFGNHTRLLDGGIAGNGYEALAQYDKPAHGGNGNGIIDPGDAVFSKLLIWTDSNHNGQTDPGELQTLAQAGIAAIDLTYHLDQKTDQYGNAFRFRGRALRISGSETHEMTTYDVFFMPASASPGPNLGAGLELYAATTSSSWALGPARLGPGQSCPAPPRGSKWLR